MKKKIIYLPFLFILIFTTAYLTITKISSYNMKLLELQRNFLNEKQNHDDLYVELKSYINMAYIKVEDFNLVNIDNETKTLREILNSDKLCFYFTENMCNSCITVQIDKVREFEKKYGVNKLLIFTHLDNNEKLKHLNKIYQTNAPIYHIDIRSLLAVNINRPIVFILRETLEINSYFSIENSLTELNDIYFEQISYFFEN